MVVFLWISINFHFLTYYWEIERWPPLVFSFSTLSHNSPLFFSDLCGKEVRSLDSECSGLCAELLCFHVWLPKHWLIRMWYPEQYFNIHMGFEIVFILHCHWLTAAFLGIGIYCIKQEPWLPTGTGIYYGTSSTRTDTLWL